MHGSWAEIEDGVLVGRYRFYEQNIGVIVGHDGVLVIDTRTTPRQAREILDDIAAQTRLPVRWFVNTHWHYDHAFGNALMRPAEGWGHAACAPGLLAHAERMRSAFSQEVPGLAAEVAEVVIDPPERSFETTATIDLGDGRNCELAYLGRAHTDSDIVVTIPHAGVLFAGDMLENGGPPYFGDGYPIAWPDTVERMLPLVRGQVVPGHGDVAGRIFVDRQLADFRAVASLARQAVAEGLSIDDVLSEAPWDGHPQVREALERALAELRGELEATAT
ncbi:MAG TPA: MBL fold metallo-hydrolase [Candidatus Limnocylindrales bacterium]|nr:MBL fold metallo-hydrolase [Candidatus Limnocylindrales bacterium]